MGPWAGAQVFPRWKETGWKTPPAYSSSSSCILPDPSRGPLLPLCLPPPDLLAPHLTPDYLIKGKNLGAINDLPFLLLPPRPSHPLSVLPASTRVTVSGGGTRLGQRWRGAFYISSLVLQMSKLRPKEGDLSQGRTAN